MWKGEEGDWSDLCMMFTSFWKLAGTTNEYFNNDHYNVNTEFASTVKIKMQAFEIKCKC